MEAIGHAQILIWILLILVAGTVGVWIGITLLRKKAVSSINTAHSLWVCRSFFDPDRDKKYDYDSDVRNYLQVIVGDIVVMVDEVQILGFAKIMSISEQPKNKQYERCPVEECGTTHIYERKIKHPKYSCKNGHVFEEPNVTSSLVSLYTAHFGDSFIALNERFAVDGLMPFYTNGYNQNLSIQKLNFRLFDMFFPNTLNALNNKERGR